MEINKEIFGNRSLEQIPLPTSRVRVSHGLRQIHFYTFEEFKNFFATGKLEVLDETAWTDLANNPATATTPNSRPKDPDDIPKLKEG